MFCCFFPPLPPTLGTEDHANGNNPRIVQQQKYHNYRRCSDWFKVKKKKKKEDSIVKGCTLTDSQQAIRCCVCSCHQGLISLEESAPVQRFTKTKGRVVSVKPLPHFKVPVVEFFSVQAHFSPHIFHCLKLLWQFYNDDDGRISGG